MVKENKYSSQTIDLNGEWAFAWTEHPAAEPDSAETARLAGLTFYSCTVPGNFELDLFQSGHLPDPFFGMNPVEVRKATEQCHVYYTRPFKAENLAGADTVLVFEGLDCFADVFVNGRFAASFDNMLIGHEIVLNDYLSSETNELFIHIRPAVAEAVKFDYPQLVSSGAFGYESLYVRKAPHMYGWDIMPRFVSAGIFRPVRIEYRPHEGIGELYLKTVELSEDHALARLILYYKLNVALHDREKIRIRMTHETSYAGSEDKIFFSTGKIVFEIRHPELWWPKGRGEASLYDVEVTLLRDDTGIDTHRFRHGIRTVELKRTPLTTSTGEGEFVFIVNGEKVFIKGTNWVPADAFHSRDRERIPAILDLVNDLNCNMVRCWGGNIYEDDIFYDICDRSGILIWQDFTMACNIYPQDDVFAAKIAGEAACVLKRLRNHACVALWSGDNECDWAYLWGHSHTDPNTNILTRKVLPEAIRLHDGARPYIGSSPFIDKDTLGKGMEYLTEMHLWGPRDYFKSRFYTESLCHFVSEIGYHGCPAPESIERFISKDRLWPCLNNEEWLLHATSPVPGIRSYDYRIELMRKQIAELFTAVPDNLPDFAAASQIVQAEAFKFFIELFRMAKWRRTGILWWNVMDGWPQFSDAVVDYYFNRKLAYQYIKTSQQDVCVMLAEPDSWKQNIVLSNDTHLDRSIQCRIQDIDTGEILFDERIKAHADRATVIGQIPYLRNRQRFYLISWQGDVSGYNHYLAGQPPFDLAAYRTWLGQSGLYQCSP
jgi:beta-mannosidase